MRTLLMVGILLASIGVSAATKIAAAEAPAKAAPKPVTAFNALPWKYNVLLSTEVRFERDTSQQMADRHLFGIAFGVRKGPSTVLFEYSRFGEQTGNATLSLDRTHEEYTLWWKQNILTYEAIDFFVAGGLGAYNEKVVTTLAGSGSATDTGGMQFMGGVAGGAQSVLWRYLLVSVEGRLMAGRNFDPNPEPGILLRVGADF